MDIGRTDIAHRLKQYFELVGQMKLSLGEGIVPTVQLVDLGATPFSLDVPFVGCGGIYGDAAEHTYIVIRPTGLPQNSWASIDQLWIDVESAPALGAGVYIRGMKLSDVPVFSAGSSVVPMQRADIDGTFAGLPEVDVQIGWSATAPPNADSGTARLQLVGNTERPIHIRHRWGLAEGGALVITSNLINLGLRVSIAGRVHFTSSK